MPIDVGSWFRRVVRPLDSQTCRKARKSRKAYFADFGSCSSHPDAVISVANFLERSCKFNLTAAKFSSVTRRMKFVLAGISLVFCLFVFVAAELSSTPSPHMAITFVGYTNSVAGKRMALLKIANQGDISMDRDTSCTIYWDDTNGAPKYSFAFLNPGSMIRPGNYEIISLPPPPFATSWHTSFTFTLHQDWVRKAIRTLLGGHRSGPVPIEDQTIGVPGPNIELKP